MGSRRACHLCAMVPFVLGFSVLFALTASVGADEVDEAVRLMPEQHRSDLVKQLPLAGDNRAELLGAIRAVKPEHRPALGFLLENMPQRDLKSLDKDYLLETIEYAYKARAEAPWGPTICDELFFNCVLPYASVNERRDRWRKDFFDRFMVVAKKCRTPGEAAVRLNEHVFRELKVRYHATKRPKPDQSPYESIEAHYASCTGLSVMLVDACRAVCIPARLAGAPLWTTRKGNHSWVEIWDRQWHFTGAAEPRPLDDTWFNEVASKADPTKVEYRIYATSFKRTGTWFPLVWDLKIRYVHADDVTCFYTTRRKVTFRIVDRQGGKPVEAGLSVRQAGRLVAQDTVKGSASFHLAGSQAYDVCVRPSNCSPAVNRQVTLTADDDQLIEIPLAKPPSDQ